MPDDIFEYWMSCARELAHKFKIEQFDTSSEMWSWNNFKDDIQSLRNRLGFEDSIEILGLKLDLETAAGKSEFSMALAAKISNKKLSVYKTDGALQGGCNTGTTIAPHSILRLSD